MKNLSYILNGVLIIAVGILYVLHFTSSEHENADSDHTTLQSSGGNLKVAYVDSDSLLQKYKLYDEMIKKLEAKRDKLDKELKNRQDGLQSEVEAYQRNQANLTIGQARAIEEDLVQKQQNLQQYQQKLTQDLITEQNKINQQLYDNVAAFLDGYSKENNLQIVLTYQKGNPTVLYANDSLNITKSVVEGLNRQYDKDQEILNKADTTAN